MKNAYEFPIKVLLDEDKNVFIPFITTNAVLVNGTDETAADQIANRYTKQEVDNILTNHNIYVSNKIMYDYVYVATMCKADYLGSSIKDENHLALYIKDTIDDVDASNETTFRRWLATMIGNGMPIDWDELL